MLVGIIGANNLRYSPYINYYIEILEKIGLDYKVIVPDRDKLEENKENDNLISITWDRNENKIISYVKYSYRIKKIITKKFDFLIVLTTINGVFCFPWLKKYFPGRYIFDIRDYTHENNKIFYNIECNVIKYASRVVISSEYFKKFLPNENYLICHNITGMNDTSNYCFKKCGDKVIIGYVGAIAYEENCKKMIDLVVEDERFEFYFYGTGICEDVVRNYAENFKCKRIKFFGAYKPKQKPDIIKKVDILFNAYGNGNPLLDYALSNKLYDALYYKKFLLTSPNTGMSKMADLISYPIDFNKEKTLDNLWKWCHSIDTLRLDKFSKKLYQQFFQENEYTKEQIALAITDNVK